MSQYLESLITEGVKLASLRLVNETQLRPFSDLSKRVKKHRSLLCEQVTPVSFLAQLTWAVFVQIMISCTKGILNDSLETVNQVLERVLPHNFHDRLAYLSGPSFAAEVIHLPALPGTK